MPLCDPHSSPRETKRRGRGKILRNCYRNSFALAAKRGLKTIAVPIIGADQPDLVKKGLLTIAKEEISSFLVSHDDTFILLVVPDKAEIVTDTWVRQELQQFIRHAQAGASDVCCSESLPNLGPCGATSSSNPVRLFERKELFSARDNNNPNVYWSRAPKRRRIDISRRSLQRQIMLYERRRRYKKISRGYQKTTRESNNTFYDALPNATVPATEEKVDNSINTHYSAFEPQRGAILDESFSEMVMRKISERGYKKDSECYSKANIDRKLFSRIRCDKQYHPKKTTALALAVALELSLSETNELLMKAGYSLSPSILSDLIVECCIRKKIYNIFEINELLFQYDQTLLGG